MTAHIICPSALHAAFLREMWKRFSTRYHPRMTEDEAGHLAKNIAADLFTEVGRHDLAVRLLTEPDT